MEIGDVVILTRWIPSEVGIISKVEGTVITVQDMYGRETTYKPDEVVLTKGGK